MLTPKQEKFIQGIVSGKSQRQAYKDAYNVKKMKDETIDVQASKLFNNDKVSIRYKELMEKLESEAIMTAQERMKWLTEVIKDVQQEDLYIKTEDGFEKVGKRNADLTTKMKAMDILNKMSGEYVTKVDGNVGITKLEDLL